MSSQLMEQIASDAVMTEAYDWLCQARIDYSANADIWDLRKNWSFIQPQLQRQLLATEFCFSPQTQHRFADGTKVVWAAIDSLVLKCIAIVLTPFLTPFLSKRCFNIKGNGGLKAAVRETQQAPIKRLVDYGLRWLGWFAAGGLLATGYVECVKLGVIVKLELTRLEGRINSTTGQTVLSLHPTKTSINSI